MNRFLFAFLIGSSTWGAVLASAQELRPVDKVLGMPAYIMHSVANIFTTRRGLVDLGVGAGFTAASSALDDLLGVIV